MIARFAAYEVDFDRVEIRASGELVPVEPQVFDVLAYLIEHRDRLVTKEEVLDNVWGDRFVSESALTSRIKSARQAVGDSGRAQEIIKTVHGRGYRFVAEVELTEAAATPEREAAPAVGLHDGPDGDAPELDSRWPLVGRHDELDELDQCFRDPARNGVLLTGPIGVGKTRLAREAVERAGSAGYPTIQISGHAESEQIPLASLAHLMPADVIEAGAQDGDLARASVFQRARAALEDLSAGSRLVMMVDNADHIDELSGALIGSLVGSGSVFAIMTQRTAPGDALVLDELIRSNQVRHLELSPLDDTDLDVLLYRVLAGPIDLGSLAQLTELSRGLPGALQQLVEACLATHSLDRQADVWRLVGPIQPAAGRPGHDRLVISDLEPAVLAGAELLAVAGELDLDVATDLAGADVLDTLDRTGLLALTETSDGPRVSLAHAHVSLLLAESLGPLRARRHKHRLIAALSGEAVSQLDRLRLIRWSVETGDAPPRDQVLEAAHHAVARADGTSAEVLLDHLDATEPGGDARQLRAELHFRRGQMNIAERLLEEISGHDVDPTTAATVLRRRATIQFHVRARFDEALGLLAEGEASFDEPVRSLITAHSIGLQSFLGFADSVIERAATVPDDLDGPPRLEVTRGLAQAHLLRGEIGEALRLLDEHDRASAALPPGAAQAGAEVSTSIAVTCHLNRGDLTTASDLVRTHLPFGKRTMLAWLPMAAARSELAAGRARAARELILTPLAAVRSQNLIHAEPQMTALLAHANARLGDVEPAHRQAMIALESVDDLRGQLRWSLVLSVGEVLAAVGDSATALDLLLPNADEAHDVGAIVTEAQLLASAAMFGAAAEVVDRLDGLAPAIEGDIWPVRARHVRAIADGADPEEFRRISSEYRRLGNNWLADISDRAAHTA
ncbi:MAG: winged helix-turn-helix domain-containing protein [Ilumatobacter sp.]|uniref:winged helix-turn-helix domain-containing protein n=1 Tax=Ilumatobacter sp. TaxID=1967498 RepID=UPI002607549B|nr:winged helix-turn-helix domain-containing protein [Ilumatobacter sp.]MDJ0768507.1 winged helix-turn-helix domain-containing protein [Ilumatobacter sp.]